MLPLYEKLFNIIFTTGKLPSRWLEGNIIPIYKNKGGKNNPQNYRPITILSCIGKLFTSILNDRLNTFSEEYEKIHENQAGFRKEYSTSDHLLSLHILSELLMLQKKRLYCAFTDFEKAFDNVWRKGLWYKLCVNNINGYMYNIITKMYNHIKSRIVHGDGISEFFNCENGVRQGENLSSFLFSIYLNDMQDFLQENVVNGLPTISEMFEQHLDMYFRLFVLLYAGDTGLIAQSAEQLQFQINDFHKYCKKWNLKININKTKILVIRKGNPKRNFTFVCGDNNIEIVNDIYYLRILFSKSRSFKRAKQKQVEKANKAVYEILKKDGNIIFQYSVS
jgi:hypothetical protein